VIEIEIWMDDIRPSRHLDRPACTKLRVIDAAGGTPRDGISIPDAAMVPLACGSSGASQSA